MKKQIVIIRHGESLGNIENRFTGWLDVDLTTHGFFKAFKAGLRLKELNFNFDLCYTSLLKRAIKTSWSVLEGMNNVNLKTNKTKYLNERHYGDISGLKKIESNNKYGENFVDSWLDMLSPDSPPKLKKEDIKKKYLKIKNRNYNMISTESLKSVFNRIIRFWKINIIPKLKLNKLILLVAHSNVLKILISYLLKDYSEKTILPNNTPMVIELTENFKSLNTYLI